MGRPRKTQPVRARQAPRDSAAAEALRTGSQAKLAAMDRMEAAAGLASVFGHDLNQPLTAIMAYCEAGRSELKRPDFSKEKLLRYLEQSVAQARRASELIRDVRKSIAARRAEPARVALDLNAVAAAVRALFEERLQEAGVRLVLDLAPGLAPVEAAPLQIEYLVTSLLKNALEALPAGQQDKWVRISTAEVGGAAELRVEDNGTGIPAEKMPHLFRAFHHSPSGLGMGLWTARSIAEAHGGKLSAENRPEGGAVFHLLMPFS